MTDTKLLRETIKNSGISMVFLAEKTGITRETLYNRFDGKGEFRASEIYKISKVLHLTPEQRDEIFFANEGE